MVITGSWQGRPLTISVKRNCLTVSVDDPANADVFSYDLAGRLWTAYLDGIAYRRGLDGRILARWRPPGEERQRVWLSSEKALTIEFRSHQTVSAVYQAIDSGDARLNHPLPEAGHTAFQRVITFDEPHSLADARRYHEVYQPIGILPPDQYMAVVLQATEGCSFNTCTFCTFYKNRPFQIKSSEAFHQHAQAVKDFLGDGLSLRRTIFLGDANALVVPMPKLLPLLEEVHQVYDVVSLGGIYAFLDGFSGEKKSVQDYRLLNQRGLKRVYIGLESGSAELLHFLKKPGHSDDAIQAVQAMKAGG
ncbi:MAG: radical SAM protein, partial [Anaerolineae bacterium]|nr:radical SAM protein [Anaerolineae bacterium]